MTDRFADMGHVGLLWRPELVQYFRLLITVASEMNYEVFYSDEAVEKLKNLRAFDRAAILDEIDRVLLVNPTQESKARVKLLRQPAPTLYRLRVGEYRVFYDVTEQSVMIVQILSKAESVSYLEGPE